MGRDVAEGPRDASHYDRNIADAQCHKLPTVELKPCLQHELNWTELQYSSRTPVHVKPAGIHVLRTEWPSFAAVFVANRYELGRDADARDL